MRVSYVGHEPVGAGLSRAWLAVLVVVDRREVDVAVGAVAEEILRPDAGIIGAA